MPTKTVRCSSITLPCKCGLGPERLSGCGTAGVETAPSSVSGFRAPGGRGLASTFSLAGLVSAGNSDIQGGPTLSQTRTRLNGLVGFALLDGGIVDQSGAPQDFSSSSWLVGGAAVVGVTYFLTPTWFLDLNHTYAMTEGHTANFASPFIDH